MLLALFPDFIPYATVDSAGQATETVDTDAVYTVTMQGMEKGNKRVSKIIRTQLEFGQEKEKEEIPWEEVRPVGVDLNTVLDKINVYTSGFVEKIYKKFRRSKEILQDVFPENRVGDEISRELEDAWYLYSQGDELIPSKEVGQVLRILGQNPTEDEIVEMVMKVRSQEKKEFFYEV